MKHNTQRIKKQKGTNNDSHLHKLRRRHSQRHTIAPHSLTGRKGKGRKNKGKKGKAKRGGTGHTQAGAGSAGRGETAASLRRTHLGWRAATSKSSSNTSKMSIAAAAPSNTDGNGERGTGIRFLDSGCRVCSTGSNRSNRSRFHLCFQEVNGTKRGVCDIDEGTGMPGA